MHGLPSFPVVSLSVLVFGVFLDASGLMTSAVSLMPETMWLIHLSFLASDANSTQSPSEFLLYICLMNSSVVMPIFLAMGVASFFHHFLESSSASFCCVRFMVVKK